MQYSPDRARELIAAVPWRPGELLRIFWLRLSQDSRQEFASQLAAVADGEALVPLIIREAGFLSANAILADVNRILEANRSALEQLAQYRPSRLTVALLAKEDFRLPQTSSPIVLPAWFPVRGGSETHVRISDLGLEAEVALLNCPESRIEHTSMLLFELEQSIVNRLLAVASVTHGPSTAFAATLLGTDVAKTDGASALAGYASHLATIKDRRAYRPSAQASPSLVSRMLRLMLRSSPKELAEHAKALANAVGDNGSSALKPTLFAVMLRPTTPLTPAQRNWHAVMLAVYQAYQVMNGAAHAGDYAPYPVTLIHAASVDLRRFLVDARMYIDGLTH